jgi:hypothetical protein
MAVIRRSLVNVLVGFFRRLNYDQVRLAGRWLYYGLYRMLVLMSGGSFLTGAMSARRLGGFRIVEQLMWLISTELQSACDFGRLVLSLSPRSAGLRGPGSACNACVSSASGPG